MVLENNIFKMEITIKGNTWITNLMAEVPIFGPVKHSI